MDLVIRRVGVWEHPNIRTWEPDDPERVDELIFVDIGPRRKDSADTFTLRVATPKGLEQSASEENILAARSLLVMRRYDFQDLWVWLERTVDRCEAETWLSCVEKLTRFFDWEFDDYKEY